MDSSEDTEPSSLSLPSEDIEMKDVSVRNEVEYSKAQIDRLLSEDNDETSQEMKSLQQPLIPISEMPEGKEDLPGEASTVEKMETDEVPKGFTQVISKRRLKAQKRREKKAEALKLGIASPVIPAAESKSEGSAKTTYEEDYLQWLRDGLNSKLVGGPEDEKYLASLTPLRRSQEIDFRAFIRRLTKKTYAEIQRDVLLNDTGDIPMTKERMRAAADQFPPFPCKDLRKTERFYAETQRQRGTLLKVNQDTNIAHIALSRTKKGKKRKICSVFLREFKDFKQFTNEIPRIPQQVEFAITGHLIENVTFVGGQPQKIPRTPKEQKRQNRPSASAQSTSRPDSRQARQSANSQSHKSQKNHQSSKHSSSSKSSDRRPAWHQQPDTRRPSRHGGDHDSVQTKRQSGGRPWLHPSRY